MNFNILVGQQAKNTPRPKNDKSIILKNFSLSILDSTWISQFRHKDGILVVSGYVVGYSLKNLHRFVETCITNGDFNEIKKLSGNYALIHFSETKHQLTISTDISGCIPIYIVRNKTHLIVTSSIQHATNKAGQTTINQPALLASLCDFPLKPNETLFTGIKRIDPQSIISINTSSGSVERTIQCDFHKLAYNPTYRNMTEDDAARLVKSWLEESVSIIAKNNGATIPLSGGIDSGNVWAAALTQKNIDSTSICAFTSQHPQYDCDETALVNQWKSKFPDYNYIFGANTFADTKEFYLQLATRKNPGLVLNNNHGAFLINKEMNKGMPRNIITGEGGDELFAGEPSALADLFLSGRIAKAKSIRVGLLRNFQNDLWYPNTMLGNRYVFKPRGRLIKTIRPAKMPSWIASNLCKKHNGILQNNLQKNRLVAPPGHLARHDMLIRYNYIQNSSFLREYFQLFNEHYMYAFHPLLEYRMVSLAYSLRPELHLSDGKFKRILRLSFSDICPPDILKQKTKHTYSGIYGDIASELVKSFPPMSEWKLVKNGYINLKETENYINSDKLVKWKYLHLYCHETFLQCFDN